MIEKQPRSIDNAPHYYVSCDKIEYSTLAVGLTDGSICSYCDARGGGYTMWNQRLINRFTKGITEAGAKAFLCKNAKRHSIADLRDNGRKSRIISFATRP